MHLASVSASYLLLFFTLYFEVFLLITYFESRSERKRVYSPPFVWPTVSILVPSWNEEATISKTINSLLSLDYPKDKLSIFVIDDGSTDNTWNVIKKFKKWGQITLLKKENGGKASALNYALQYVKSEFVGSLDADSFVHPQALKRIMLRFEDRETMAVTPSIKIHEPKNIIELIQKVEYIWSILLRNLMAYLGALYVTPGPLSIFRTEIFSKIGGYRDAHQTEDMEMAMRMQANRLKIGNAPDAYVYTVAPKNIKGLYKQRLRWTYGFIRNVIDYRRLFLNPQYGNLGMIILPISSISLISSVYLLGSTVVDFFNSLLLKIIEVNTVGWNFNWSPTFELFYVNTAIINFLGVTSLFVLIFFIFASKKMAEEKWSTFGLDVLSFLVLYAFMAPVWISRAIYNAAFSRSISWR